MLTLNRMKFNNSNENNIHRINNNSNQNNNRRTNNNLNQNTNNRRINNPNQTILSPINSIMSGYRMVSRGCGCGGS